MEAKGEEELGEVRRLEGGGHLWKASLVLLEFLDKKEKGNFKGKKLLELGAGEGVLAEALSKMGAKVTATERGGGGGCLDRLKMKADMACAAGLSMKAVELEWGERGWELSELKSHVETFDYVILSELFYDQESHEDLLWTLLRVTVPGSIVYSVFCDRPFSFMFFALLHDTGEFDVEEIPEAEVDKLGMSEEAQIHLHKIVRR
mmetsp:Transcript_43692/g.138135  ORF Transcript_43692/g.138135 Transcript_43692/m.138135 type:complete len:204 (-) Transcript_43692:117-728(-)